jgi:hypothetical protein
MEQKANLMDAQKLKKFLSQASNSLLFILVLLFGVDVFTTLEVANQHLKYAVYYGIIIIPPVVCIINIVVQRTARKKAFFALPGLIVLMSVLIAGPYKIIFSSSVWKTQAIVYQHAENQRKRIVFQMQDVGAHGYNRRTVELTSYALFNKIKEPKSRSELGPVWILVNEDRNEQGLKGG